jgi:DNA-directed RNA polymerase specialized sigma24 family protein
MNLLLSFQTYCRSRTTPDWDAFCCAAFEEVKRICSIPLRYLPDADREDHVQEAVIMTFEKIDRNGCRQTFGNEARFRAWIGTIARNTAVDQARRYVRRLRRNKRACEHWHAHHIARATNPNLDPDFMRKFLLYMHIYLSPLEIDVLHRHIVEEETFESIARALNLPGGGAEAAQLYKRAIEMLKRFFKGEHE